MRIRKATILAGVALLSGCSALHTQASKPTGPPEGKVAPAPAVPEKFLKIESAAVPEVLRRSLFIENYHEGLTEQGVPEVTLDLVSRRDTGVLALDIRTVYFRDDGTVIDVSEWSRVTVKPGLRLPYRCVSFTPYAVRAEVQLRVPENAVDEQG